MSVQSSLCDSTTCNFGSIPATLVSFDMFVNVEFDDEFCKIFSKNPINPECSPCFVNFAKLLYALLKAFDLISQEVDIRYNYTRVFIEHCYQNFIKSLKQCP